MKYKTALVLGAGAFGTSMASIVAQNFEKVFLMVRDDKVYEQLLNKENAKYLPGLKLPDNLIPIKFWDEEKFNDLELIVSGLPTGALYSYLEKNKVEIERYLSKGIGLVSLSKGIHSETLELSDDIFFKNFSQFKDQITFLSGPSFAKEIIEKQVTMVSLAGCSREELEKTVAMLQTNFFKLLPTYDIKGVLLGGALKNILAIAGGITEGLGFNYNTRAAMITRGIVEMLRYGKVFNARPETFYGLSGMGDLILTTTGELSRNKAFGRELSKGKKAKEVISESKQVVEGYKTAKSAYLLGQKYKIRAPLMYGIHDILFEEKKPVDVLKSLMELPVNFDD